MAEKRYRAGAIGRTGQGNFGHGLHVPYQKIDCVDMIAVSDPNTAGREKAIADAGAQRGYADYRDMLAKEDLDIVSVCPRWVDCHEEKIVACIEAGCHVYAEKPLAGDLATTDRIVAAAEQHNRKIAVAHQAVYLRQLHQVRDLIRENQIGKLLSMHGYGKQDHRGGGEDMLVLGTHLFNMMRFLGGDPLWMTARVTVRDREIAPEDVREATEPIGAMAGDGVVSLFSFGDGVDGSFVSRANQSGKGQGYGLVLVGESGRIAISGGAEAISIYEDGLWAPWRGGREWQVLDLAGDHLQETGNYRAIIDLIDAIERDRAPISSDRDARWALEMIHGAYASQISGQRVVFPNPDRSHPLEKWHSGH